MKLIIDKILIPKFKFFLFTLFFLLLYSCSRSSENPLLGTWQSSDTLSQSTLTLSSSNGNKTFVADHFGPQIKNGKWQTLDRQLWLRYIPSFVQATDSVLYFQNSQGETGIRLFDSVNTIATIRDGKALVKYESIAYDYELIDGQLSLKGNGSAVLYQKKVPPRQSVSLSSISRGVLGMFFLILVAFLLSSNRSNINWTLVGKGLLLQVVIAIAVLKVPFIEQAFDFISRAFVKVISFTNSGINFLFGQFGYGEIQSPLLNFTFTILPTIIFFSALVSLFYYYGIIQKIIFGFAWVMKKLMHLSGAESLAAAGNVFLGQTESPLLVKPYLDKMTKSEIMCLMTGGMATIAGGVLAAFVGFLGGDDPVQQAFFAKHLLTASIISAPAAIIAAKILVPETENINTNLKVDKTKLGTNALEALSNGTTDGLKLAINVGAMLLVFISIMALGNYALGFTGRISGLNDWISANTPYAGLSFEFILGYLGRPIVWLMGVNWVDSVYVGELLGTKTVLNEFVGYMRLGEMKTNGLLSEKSTIISTYILCGFANFSSIGIQIGGIGALAPNRKGLLSKLGVKALIGGTIACLMTAAIVGMMY
ncbi:MAG: NupC/NupG family nucleoside CNT transporter [Crocinitomicaceae bacterium]